MRPDKPLFSINEVNTMSWIIDNAKRSNQDTSYIYLLPDYYDNLKACVYFERCLLKDIETQDKQAKYEHLAITEKELKKIDDWIANWIDKHN